MATSALGVGVANSIQIAKLEASVEETKSIARTAMANVQVSMAQTALLKDGMILLGAHLNETNKVVNSIIERSNRQQGDIHAMNEPLLYLAGRVDRLESRVEHNILYTAINDMIQNKLTLKFVAPTEFDELIQTIVWFASMANTTFPTEIPLTSAITQLLISQQLTFIPWPLYSATRPIIGK
ncbi:unnamed protein product [Didymodactylos carnosus]|uniref:Uncharacterized protein n=1 Tax=Didymodactylos carnosus TaxID=1234261 RepID=A0A815DL76_9BILA|nr:unnamed protein product [Didymodactylos carnosus]CAF4130727.1 unnamed protein product [Didymodactylos carnosus]